MSIIETKHYKIVKEMCSQRGYNILSETEDSLLYDTCTVYFTGNVKINIKYIKELIQMMEIQKIDHVIIVYSGGITVSVRKIIELTEYFNIELFEEKELNFNITNHTLVPKHNLVEDKDELLQLVKHRKNLPLILSKDPIVKFFAFKKGSILRVERGNGTIVYRVVC